MTFVCPTRGKQLVLQTMGHAFAGGGFFCLSYPEEADAGASDLLGVNAALVSAAPGVLSKEILEAELPHLFEGEWDWQVAPFDVDCFSVAFPDPAFLRMVTRSGKLFLPINNIMANIRDAVLAEPKALMMSEVWVKMWSIPPKQQRAEHLMAATTMIGRPLVVDELSLIRSGPVRMRFACRVPAKLRGSVQIWFNGEGYNIKLKPELESRPAAPALPPPPPPSSGRGPNEQDKDKQKDKDQEQDASMEEDDSIDTAAWEKLGISAPGPIAQVVGATTARAAEVGGSVGMTISIPNQYGSNLGSVSSPPWSPQVRVDVCHRTASPLLPRAPARLGLLLLVAAAPPLVAR